MDTPPWGNIYKKENRGSFTDDGGYHHEDCLDEAIKTYKFSGLLATETIFQFYILETGCHPSFLDCYRYEKYSSIGPRRLSHFYIVETSWCNSFLSRCRYEQHTSSGSRRINHFYILETSCYIIFLARCRY